jgi:hypothetical protein
MKIFFTKHYPILHVNSLLFKKFLISDFLACFLLSLSLLTAVPFERFVPFCQTGNAWEKNAFAIPAKGIVQNDFGGPAVMSRLLGI